MGKSNRTEETQMYRRINIWLASELSWWKMPYYIVLAALSIWAMDQVVLLIMYGTVGIQEAEWHRSSLNVVPLSDFWTRHFPMFLKEEMFFRAPLFIAAFIPPMIVPAILFNSIIFGWLHGDIFNIPIQGISGVIFSVMFLKFGGMQRNIFKGLKGLTASTATHTLFMFGLWTYAWLFG